MLMLLPLPLLCCASQTHYAVALPVTVYLEVERSTVYLAIAVAYVFHKSLISGSVSQTTNGAALAPYLYIEIFLKKKPPCILAITVASAFRPKHRF
jgi:hypothetical protein